MPKSTAMEVISADNVETVWTILGMALLVVTVAALVSSARRAQWVWFVVCIFIAPIAPVLYFASGAQRRS